MSGCEKYPGFALGIRDSREDAAARKQARIAEREDPKYLAWIRKQPCIIAGHPDHRCKGRVEAHHEEPKGKRTDWHDRKTVPLCALAHSTRHAIGATRFMLRFHVGWAEHMARLWAKHGAEAES